MDKGDNNKRPHPRGYYSELATDENFKAKKTVVTSKKKSNFLWEIVTERNAPTILNFGNIRQSGYLAPAERWMCYDAEKTISFPVDVFKPKVQLQHFVDPFKIPRNVQIERKMRQYQRQDIKQCLLKLDIRSDDILPVEILKKNWEGVHFGLFKMLHWLPLEWFDDKEYCSRSPEGWLNHGLMEGVRHPIPAQALLPRPKYLLTKLTRLEDLYEWTNVAVLGYDKYKEKYKLLTLDGLKRSFYLAEIYLLFKAEEPMKCARRIKAALDLRNATQVQIRYEFIMDCMEVTGTYEIPDYFMEKIERLAFCGKPNKIVSQEFLDSLKEEVQLNHKRSLGEMEFRKSVLDNPDMYKFIKLPPRDFIQTKEIIDINNKNFKAKCEYFRWFSIYVLPQSLLAISQVVLECLKVQQMNLFTTNYGKVVTLEEFEIAQNKFTSHVMKYLKYTWIDATCFNLRWCLGEVGKGWFDINERTREIFDLAKLTRLFECVKFRMQYALRVLVENSVTLFTNLVEVPCQPTLVVDEDYVWESDYINSPFVPKVAPVFYLQVKFSEHLIYYSTDLEAFGKTLLRLYDTAIIGTHSIKQVHPMLLVKLKFPNDLYLSSVGLFDKYVCECRERFILGYQNAIIPLKAYAKTYEAFLELYNLNIPQYIANFKEEQHTASEVKDEVSYHLKMRDKLEESLPSSIIIGPFSVNVEIIKQTLVLKRGEIAKKLLDQFAEKMKNQFIEVIEEYQDLLNKLLEKPQSIEHIFDIKDWMETVPMTIRALEENTKRYIVEYDILDHFWYNLPQDDFDAKWEAIGWPYKLMKQIDETNEFLVEETEKFFRIQQSDEMGLAEKIEALTVQITAMYSLKDPTKCHEIAIEMKRAWKVMKESQEYGQLLNSRQKLFNVPVVPFDTLTKLIKEFEPYKNLWVTASDWWKWYEVWMDNPLANIDGESIDRTVTDMYKTMVKCIRIFADIPGVQLVAMDIKDRIEEFKPYIPLIQGIRNPGMKERHWEDFAEQTGIVIPWTAATTFKDCLDMGVGNYIDIVSKISDNAGKEYSIELTLDKMLSEWEHNNLELTPFKKSGTFIMKVSDDIQQMLDDHIVLTQQLSFSPFKAALSDRIDEWEEQLKTTFDVIEEWMDVQKQWMYLEPIFTSPDISKQLPVESKKYNSMERTWRRIMKSAHDKPLIIEFCPDKKLLESLRDANHILEIVQKGLAEYLEVKRTTFPRLFFLSDDELLEILSQARNPLAVQPHLRKCFENIARLKFEDDLRITQMFSAEDECVDLNPTLYPTSNVEDWLLIVEGSMKNTVRTVFGDSLQDLMIKERRDWVLRWPGQIVIAGCQTYWTSGVELGINTNSLPHFFEVLLENLDQLRGLVKGTLTFLQRDVLSALIVIEVHARDVTQLLVDRKVSNINDFDWISQLRYYWVNDEHLKVRAVNAEFQYGYEYLGNSGRLVITPLTDRCYLTLTGALHLKFGGAPAGPAGTGKTETTKDLAKAFAIQCVVFNCSDQLDFMAMGKFFKGLASSGAWACFDEFNRIDIEVLSVVAQQIMTIQKAQQSRQDRLLFEGADIALKDSCAVFITMNPGYAGRTELPDNLKALFRPVAMMVPNYSLIAEISLFSFGFGNAKQLANKITTTFKLSSEQLSSQDHYDFGMRAVKTVIAVAGNLKREKPNMDERQIVLRSLRDVNVPKFLKDDLKLFNGIVSDLFPRMVEEAVDYGALEQSIRTSCIEVGLEDVNDYVKKVIQLYETTVVRHGLMLVGPTGSGKTKCYEILKDAMTALMGKPSPSGYPFQRVWTYVLNPKSITMGQLYGEFDLQTHEWTDGILPSLVRIGVAAEDKDKRWYVFDGPVDAVWIENMNTVLDDNKKLCLSSGEIIKLRDTQTMMFEVADLAVASPATVSRCGMVYLEPGVLGLPPFMNCWLKKLPPLAAEFAPAFQALFDQYLYPALELLRTHLKEILMSVDSAIVISFLHLLDFRLGPLAGKDNKPPPPSQFLKLIPELIAPWVLFSLIWSIGATCDNDGRVVFSNWLRAKTITHKHKPQFPAAGLVYDYKLHDGGFTDTTPENEPIRPSWHHWMEEMEEYKISIDMKYSDIEVPTIDNTRNALMIGMILYNEKNVLCVGPTGTGKTLTVIGKLGRNMHKKFLCDFINFSARTSANQTQDLIDSKLDRRRKGVYGPPVLKRQVFFIDDFNMPALEVYGAQPPIELIRQWMDFKGWYDRKNIGEFRSIIDCNFVAAMGPPGGGRNPVTLRLLRHFHYLTFLEMEDNSQRTIFGKILRFWLERTPGFQSFFEQMLSATLSVYLTILKELLPTPAKTHYTFNLRDLSKVFQGVLMKDPEKIENIEEIIKLWYHENCRVFQDRLVNDDDRNWFDSLLKSKIVGFKYNVYKCLGDNILLYCDFMDHSSDIRYYEYIDDSEKVSKVLNHYLGEFNAQSTRPMKLVLFLDAIAHMCRISRIIRQPMGNALLLGVGGSGRQSLTRLAAFIGEFFCFQIELTKAYSLFDWKEDIKGLMLKAGLMKIESVFLFSDTQIKSETFLEDLNNMLNSGDVPNIYQPDEMDKIYQGLKGTLTELGITATKSNLFAIYQRQVRSNLHTVITMSPIGEIFRARLRQFPALVNCCTIDWFSAWPDSALQSVALQFLNDIPELQVSDAVLSGIVMVCQYMHASVVSASQKYFEELSRHNYVTPTSYLQLLHSYTDLMQKKKGGLMEGVGRLTTGLEKLHITAEEAKVLQLDLEVLKPALEIAARDAEIMIEQIAKDTAIAEETRILVEKEEYEATVKKLETEAMAQDAERDLEEAMPALMAAEKSLQALNKNDITEVRAMKRPPTGVIYVIESICIVKNIKPNKVPGLRPGEKLNDYWEPGRAMLTDPGLFLVSLMNFDKDSITEEMIQKLKTYVEDPQFQPAKIIKVSKACTSLCMWVHAMYKYYFVNQLVAPKKAALKKAKADLEITEAALAKAKASMKEVMDGLEILQAKLAARIAFKEEKENNINMCQERMNRAVRLITGLADEKVRWIQTIQNIEEHTHNVTGDILICSGCVAYLTPFTDSYRRWLFENWMRVLAENNVPHSSKCDPVVILGEPVKIRQWQIEGLPRDTLSTENAVLVSCSKRWPLFIDPQGQANKWIKNMGKPRGMAICKLADKDLVRTLELAIRFGKPVLVENVGLELDPALDPILLRSVFKQGNTVMLKLGESIVPYNDDFQLFITTKLPNPHYTPEVSVKVQLVNFTLVPSGLQDQLLALVVLQERPDLEEQRSQIVVGSAQMKQELKEIEDRILHKLSTSEGSPLDDIDFIVTLEASKVKSEDIMSKVEAAEITQIDIDNTRAQYIPVANRGQILYFCLSDLSNVDPMYQYSLEWFIAIFVGSMAETEKTEDLNERVNIINNFFTFSLYSNVCRSLFEKHKLLFAFLLCIRIMLDDRLVDPHEWHHFLAGGSPTKELSNPAAEWLSEKAWIEILALHALPNFQRFVDTFPRNKSFYQQIFESSEPHREKLPKDIGDSLDEFQRLIVLKSLRPDKLTNGMQDFLTLKMGSRFVEPQTTDLSAMFKESGPLIPLIFVLSTGTDPAADLYKFADRMKMSKRIYSISLGQGQGPRAEKMIQEGVEVGNWVFFQNCHLAPSFMPRLERVIEEIPADVAHREFRIWLTSTPSPAFPVAILQSGSKMTVEPPRGLKANMLRAYLNQVSDLTDFYHSEHPKVYKFKWLLFSLCMFHGCLLERRKFGPLGFNIPYEFTDGDLKICISQLYMFMMEYDEVPFKVLTYTAGHINYGGRVTDDWDRRCLMNILAGYYKSEVMNEIYTFDLEGLYHQQPGDTTLIDCLDYIRTFPLNDDPSLFGLHNNADISCAQAITYNCLATLLTLQPKVSGGKGASQEDETTKVANALLSEIPVSFDVDNILELYPVMYTESLNTVIVQEAIRYNRLLQVIKSSLRDLLKALKGLVVMSEDLEKMSRSLFSNLVPTKWAGKAYPSLKPLGAWVKDLNDRVAFLNTWVDKGIPPVFWISGFYFPQAFLTGTLQNFARKYVVSIDTINFGFKVLKTHPTERSEDGCCIYGLFLEGCRWNHAKALLDESHPKELYTEMPAIWLKPEENHKKPLTGVYECPVYKTLTRAGTLSTTGHSTNYVLAIEVPSNQEEKHWIQRGVALICALDY